MDVADKWAEELYKELRDLIFVRQIQRTLAPPEERQIYCMVCRNMVDGPARDHIRYHMTSTPPPEFS